jgi:hypothetical protein
MQVDYRDTQSELGSVQPAAASTPPYLLLQGHHFMVKAEGKLVLDHIFGAPQTPAAPSSVPSQKATSEMVVRPNSAISVGVHPQPAAKAVSRAATIGDVTTQDSGTTMGSVSKTLGPITIRNVSSNCIWSLHRLMTTRSECRLKITICSSSSIVLSYSVRSNSL